MVSTAFLENNNKIRLLIQPDGWFYQMLISVTVYKQVTVADSASTEFTANVTQKYMFPGNLFMF